MGLWPSGVNMNTLVNLSSCYSYIPIKYEITITAVCLSLTNNVDVVVVVVVVVDDGSNYRWYFRRIYTDMHTLCKCHQSYPMTMFKYNNHTVMWSNLRIVNLFLLNPYKYVSCVYPRLQQYLNNNINIFT